MCNKNRAKEYYKNKRDVILTRSKEYYINNKESIIFSLKKTPLGETGCLSNPYFLPTGSSSIQFFNSAPFPNTVS